MVWPKVPNIEELGVDKFCRKTAAVTLEVFEQFVLADTTAGAFTLTLPPVKAAAGRIFCIVKVDVNANLVTIADQDDSYGWSDLTDCNAQWDRKVLLSMGIAWAVIGSHIT